MKKFIKHRYQSLVMTSLRVMFSKKAILGTLTLLGIVFIVTACQVDTPWGPIKLQPLPGTPPSTPNCDPVLLYVDRGCEVWDWNCDGLADFINCDGVWHRPTPAPPTSPPVSLPQNDLESIPDITDGTESRSPFKRPSWEILDLSFPQPWEFDFGAWTPEEWCVYYGLDAPWNTELQINPPRIIVDTDTGETEIAIPWRSDGHFPDPETHGLDYFEIQVQMPSGSGPAFVILRLGGQAGNVASYLSAMDRDEFVSTEFDHLGRHYLLQADGVTGWVYEDGILISESPLN